MITLDETIQWVTEEYSHLIFGSQLYVGDEKAYEAVMTILSTLDYAKLLEEKFGSLEAALDAEKVTRCRECVAYKTEEFICSGILGDENKVMLPDDHCSRALTKEQYETLMAIAEKMDRVNCMPASEFMTLHVAGEE